MFELKRIDEEKGEKKYFLIIDGSFDDEEEVPYRVHGIIRVDNNMKSPREVVTKGISVDANNYLYELQTLAFTEAFGS